jgi:mitogen-activated protein kinase kinase kinase 1
VLKSFAPPQDDIHVNSPICAGDVSFSDEEDLVNEANGGGREAVDDLPVSVSCGSSPSNNETENDNDIDDCGVGSALRAKPVHSIFSPNGKFRRSVSSSWQRGQLLGSGSYGTVYEGFTE